MPLQYDDIPGSWGQMSEGWPETPWTPGKLLLCTKAEIVPYGSYVIVGAKQRPFRFGDPEARGGYDYSEAVIRVETEALKTKLEKVYYEMFEVSLSSIVDQVRNYSKHGELTIV